MEYRSIDDQLMPHHYRFKSVDDAEFFLFAVFDFFDGAGVDAV